VTKAKTPSLDPLIDDVRQRRRDLLAKYDNDLEKLHEAIKRCQDEHPEKMVDLARQRSPAPGSAPGTPGPSH
jgi:hypothetical protein